MSLADRLSNKTVQAANYCLVRIDVKGRIPIDPAVGTCLPKSCTPQDHAMFLTKIVHFLKLAENVTTVNNTLCIEPIPRQLGTTITMVIFSTFFVLCLWATLLHLCIRIFDHRWKQTDVMALGDRAKFVKPHVEKRPIPNLNGPDGNWTEKHGMTNVAQTGYVDGSQEAVFAAGNTLEPVLTVQSDDVTPFYVKLIMCFSAIHNTNRIFAPASSTHLAYLDGIRVISFLWVILGHVYLIGQNFFSTSALGDISQTLHAY